MRIYIVRHGESHTNVSGRIMSSTDLALTDRGALQAEAAYEYLSDVKFDHVFSSPLLRARQTAEIICGDKDKIVFCDELKEMLFGEMEGLTWEEKLSRYPDVSHESGLSQAKIDSGESFEDVVVRCNSFIENKLEPILDGGNVLIVSHGITLRVLINCLLKRPNEHVNYINWADNTAIAEIDLTTRSLLRLNDRKHLTDKELGNVNYEQWGLFSEKDYTQL